MSNLTPENTPHQPNHDHHTQDRDWALMVSLYPDEFNEAERSQADELLNKDAEGLALNTMLSELRSVNDPMYCEPTDTYLDDARRARIFEAAERQISERSAADETLLERMSAWLFSPSFGYLITATLLGVVMLNAWRDLDGQRSTLNITPASDEINATDRPRAEEGELKGATTSAEAPSSEVKREGDSAPELEVRWRGRSGAQSGSQPPAEGSRPRRSETQARVADRAERAPKRAQRETGVSESTQVEVRWRGRGAQPSSAQSSAQTSTQKTTSGTPTRAKRGYAPPPPQAQPQSERSAEAVVASRSPKVTTRSPRRASAARRGEASDVVSSARQRSSRRVANSETAHSSDQRRAELTALLNARTGELRVCGRLNSSAVDSLRAQVRVSGAGRLSIISALEARGARGEALETTLAYRTCVTQKIASWRLSSHPSEAQITHTFERLTLNSSSQPPVDAY